MKALVFALLLSFFVLSTMAQKSKPQALLCPDNEGIEVVPIFPGGNDAFAKYVKNNLHWPHGSKREGVVVISFFIERTGKVTGARVIKSMLPVYDAEALRVVRNSPRWHPGKSIQDKEVKPIKMQQSIPIRFSLDNN